MKPPIDVLGLFPLLNDQLISFLKNLSGSDWHKQTVAKEWVVKDVSAHLLDVNFRKISSERDGWSIKPDTAIQSNDDLVNYLNRLNADWVKSAKRLSPAILIELLESTNEMVVEIFKGLDPFASSAAPVSWAGETVSYNWFDIAREYTERWHHQQQIRDALNDTGIMTKELYYPVLDIFIQAWPFTCNEAKAGEGTILKTVVTGEGGGEWFLKMESGKWKAESKQAKVNAIVAETIIHGDIAWKLFSKSVRKEDVKGSVDIKGDRQLGEKVLDMVSVMA